MPNEFGIGVLLGFAIGCIFTLILRLLAYAEAAIDGKGNEKEPQPEGRG